MEYVAKVAQVYGSDLRRIEVGDRFHVEPRDVEILMKLGRIEPVQAYRTREMKARKTA